MKDYELINHLTELHIKSSELTVNTVELEFKVHYFDDHSTVEDTWLKELMEVTERKFYIKVGFNVLTYIFERTDKKSLL